MTEYHKIETLYERSEITHRLLNPLVLKNRVYGTLKTWHWTEKIDGTNIRCIWDSANDKLTFGGKTDNAQIHTELINWLTDNVLKDKIKEVFPDGDVVIYGEGYGAGIQKGGGYSPTKKLIVFDVLVAGKWWLSYDNIKDVCIKLGLDFVPSFGEMPLEEATEFVRQGLSSRIGEMKAEGLVGTPIETMFDKKGHRLITKLKTKDF